MNVEWYHDRSPCAVFGGVPRDSFTRRFTSCTSTLAVAKAEFTAQLLSRSLGWCLVFPQGSHTPKPRCLSRRFPPESLLLLIPCTRGVSFALVPQPSLLVAKRGPKSSARPSSLGRIAEIEAPTLRAVLIMLWKRKGSQEELDQYSSAVFFHELLVPGSWRTLRT